MVGTEIDEYFRNLYIILETCYIFENKVTRMVNLKQNKVGDSCVREGSLVSFSGLIKMLLEI